MMKFLNYALGKVRRRTEQNASSLHHKCVNHDIRVTDFGFSYECVDKYAKIVQRFGFWERFHVNLASDVTLHKFIKSFVIPESTVALPSKSSR